MAVTVRQAWLNANALISANNMTQVLRLDRLLPTAGPVAGWAAGGGADVMALSVHDGLPQAGPHGRAWLGSAPGSKVSR